MRMVPVRSSPVLLGEMLMTDSLISLPSPGRLDREPAVPFKAPVAGRENRDRFSGAQCRLRLEDGPDYSCVVNFGLVLFLAGQCQKQWCDG